MDTSVCAVNGDHAPIPSTASGVHIFDTEARVALSFITSVGSVNVQLPAQLAQEVGNGLMRLAARLR
jgi:hypothetical protein